MIFAVKQYAQGSEQVQFPFQLFHKESWDIEHIEPATENELTDDKSQKIWLKTAVLGLKDKMCPELQMEIKTFLAGSNENAKFEELYGKIQALNANADFVQDKNTIGNYVLLDTSTNRGYGNAIYPAKRMAIMGKENGIKYEIDDALEIKEVPEGKSFIPPCTRNVFMKYYTPNSTDIMNWTQDDAKAYTKRIYECLKAFGVEEPKFDN